jgi:tRNA(fMet)-specific endonuclease VapC
MSLFVLDTDILSLYQKAHTQVQAKVDFCPATDSLAITVMSVEEQLSGWYRNLRKAKNSKDLANIYNRLAMAVSFLGRWRILPLTESAIARLQQLKALKLNVAAMDLAIAAITLENDGILVSRNLRDFQRVPNLTVENWAM